MNRNVEKGKQTSQSEKFFEGKHKTKTPHYTTFIIITVSIMFIALFIFLFLLPIILIVIGSAFPRLGINVNSLEDLNDHINSVVGFSSLLLGILSIVLAVQSSKAFNVQKSSQDRFLRKIDNKINNVLGKVKNIDENNNRIYDTVTNMSGYQIQNATKANEE